MTKPKKTPSAERVLIIPDIHRPYHDMLALSCLEQAVAIIKPQEAVYLGDCIEGEMFSAWPKGQVGRTPDSFLRDELEPTMEHFKCVAKWARKIVYIEGNHEYRIERWCAREEKAGLFDMLSPRSYFEREMATSAATKHVEFQWIPYRPSGGMFGDTHYEIFPHMDSYASVGLVAVHGWSFAIHAAKIHLEAAKGRSVVHGHTHRAQMHKTRCPFTNRSVKAWSVGCLNTLNPEYWVARKPSEWTHGFGVVHRTCKEHIARFHDPLDDYNTPPSWRDFPVEIDSGYCVLEGGKAITAEV